MEKSLLIDIDINLTSSNYARLRSQIKETLNNAASNEIEEIVVDLDRTNFIDSTGIGLIVSIVKRFRNIRVRVINCSSDQYKAFSIANLTKIMDIENPDNLNGEIGTFIKIEDQDQKFIIRLQGNINYSNIKDFKSELNIALKSQTNKADHWDEFILDLAEVEMIDSAAIGAFLGIYRRAKKVKKSFQITGCNAFMLDLFAQMDLNEHFGIEKPLETNQ